MLLFSPPVIILRTPPFPSQRKKTIKNKLFSRKKSHTIFLYTNILLLESGNDKNTEENNNSNKKNICMTTTPSCCHRTNKAKVETSMPTNTPQNKRKNDPHCFLLSFLNTYTLSLSASSSHLHQLNTLSWLLRTIQFAQLFSASSYSKTPQISSVVSGRRIVWEYRARERERVHTVFPLKYNLTTISICIFTSAYSGPKLELNMFCLKIGAIFTNDLFIRSLFLFGICTSSNVPITI